MVDKKAQEVFPDYMASFVMPYEYGLAINRGDTQS